MSDYRRLYIPGGTYFFTLVAYLRGPLFGTDARVEQFRKALRYVRRRRPFQVIAGVVLPDHVHILWKLPEGDDDYSTRWQMAKTEFSRHVPASIRPDGSKTLWQPRFWEHGIRDDEDFRRHLDYIHYNPVKHGLARTPGEWPHSSFRRFVGMGWYDDSWGATEPLELGGMDCE